MTRHGRRRQPLTMTRPHRSRTISGSSSLPCFLASRSRAPIAAVALAGVGLERDRRRTAEVHLHDGAADIDKVSPRGVQLVIWIRSLVQTCASSGGEMVAWPTRRSPGVQTDLAAG